MEAFKERFFYFTDKHSLLLSYKYLYIVDIGNERKIILRKYLYQKKKKNHKSTNKSQYNLRLYNILLL